MRVLVVEDDVRLARALQRILEENDYETDITHDGEEGLLWARTGNYDVLVLDVMLPKRDGCEVAAQLRRESISTPILLLTARGAVPDKIRGLDSGADDYMTKPFSPAELLAHIRALTRRQGEVVFERLSFADVALNLDTRVLSCKDKQLTLSAKEFALARLFLANPLQVISKDTIMERVWGSQSAVSDNNVEAYVSFFRKKLRFLEAKAHVETLSKAGYRLVDTTKVI